MHDMVHPLLADWERLRPAAAHAREAPRAPAPRAQAPSEPATDSTPSLSPAAEALGFAAALIPWSSLLALFLFR